MTVTVDRLRALLPRTWYPFLGRFPRPTAIQTEAIPHLLAGLPVLLASATATGKTEAYAAPLVERMLRERWGAPGIVIVSPTRALANDLLRRLEGPLRAVGVTVQRKTGDHGSWHDLAPVQVCVTTPESLDSLLARRPETLKPVRALVLDELHVMDRTARGDQLSVLAARLERLVLGVAAGEATRGRALPVPLQRVAATATAACAEEVAVRYLGRGARVVSTDERRVIAADLVAVRALADVSAWMARHCGARRDGGARKVLVFTNSRAEAEELAAACSGRPPFGTDVFVHHASLARGERERVEQRFLAAPSALCVATTTLELGIDIGDIDQVGLIGPPHTVASLLQRVGRGNRRSWDVTRVACFHFDEGQRVRFDHLLECARSGSLFPGRDAFRPSVLVQQAFSLAYQNRSRFVDAASLAARLPAHVAAEYPAERLEEMLAHLADEELLAPLSGKRYGPTERLEKMYQRGTMHSNIARDGPVLEIVDAVTERVVGYLPKKKGRDADVPSEVVLGGQRRQVNRASGRQLRTTQVGKGSAARFPGQGSPSVSLELAQSLAEHLGVGPRHVPVVRLEQKILMAHFLGSCYGKLFSECLQRRTPGLVAAGNAFVTVFATEEPPLLDFRETDALAEISRHRRALSMALQDGPLSPKLPANWWFHWLCEALDVPAFLAIADTLRPEEEVPARLARVLVALAPRGAARGGIGGADEA